MTDIDNIRANELSLKNKLTGAKTMSSTLNLSLTDELRWFVDANIGEGTLYATPSEQEKAALRQVASYGPRAG